MRKCVTKNFWFVKRVSEIYGKHITSFGKNILVIASILTLKNCVYSCCYANNSTEATDTIVNLAIYLILVCQTKPIVEILKKKKLEILWLI